MNHKEELNKLKQLEKEIHLGGGIDAIAKHKKRENSQHGKGSKN